MFNNLKNQKQKKHDYRTRKRWREHRKSAEEIQEKVREDWYCERAASPPTVQQAFCSEASEDGACHLCTEAAPERGVKIFRGKFGGLN